MTRLGGDINGLELETGETLSSEQSIHPDHTQTTGINQGQTAFYIPYHGAGFESTYLTTYGFQPQGLAFKDDALYVAEVTDVVGTPSTIHEAARDGTLTGNTYQLVPDNANHVSSMQWHDGYLWALDYTSDTVYQIDWAAKTTVGSFTTGVDPSSMTFIPTQDGEWKILVMYWQSDTAQLINYQGALTDGTVTGNIYRTLSNGVNSRPQGCRWLNGNLYIRSEMRELTKHYIGFADTLAEGTPLKNTNVQWYDKTSEMQATDDLAFDADTGTWFMCEENNWELYSARECHHDKILGGLESWPYVAGGPEGAAKVVDADAAVVSGLNHVGVTYASAIPGWVETWYYDDASASKSVYTAVSGATIASRQTIGVNTGQTNGGTNYYRWNGTDGWVDTGVARPTNPRWVKFAWGLTGSEALFRISTDGGRTWENAGSTTTQGLAVGRLAIEASSGSARIGPWTVLFNY